MGNSLIGKLIIGTKVDDKGIQAGVKRSKKHLSRFQRSTSSISKSISGSLARMGAGLAVGSLLLSAAGNVSTFEQKVANLASTAGKSKDSISALVQNAQDVGAVSSFSASEVIDLQTELAKLGNSESEIIAMTKSVGDFSVAVGSTAADAATLTGGVLKSFGKNASDTTSLVNTLAVATTKSALDFGKLNVALPIVGTAADQMGFSVERTTSLLGVLSDRNIDAATSGTALRNIFLDLKEKGLTYEQAMAQINGSTDKLNTANQLFGKRGAVVATVLAESGAAALSLEQSITDVSGALDDMTNTRLDTAQGKTILLKSAFEGMVLSFDSGGGIISRAYKGAVEGATSLLGTLTRINTLDPAKESRKQKEELNLLLKTLIKNNDNQEVRERLVKELNSNYSEYIQNINLEKLGLEGVNKALLRYDELNDRNIQSLIQEEKKNRLIQERDSLINKVIDAEKRLQKNIESKGDFFSGSIYAAEKAAAGYREELEKVSAEIDEINNNPIKRKRGQGSSVVLGLSSQKQESVVLPEIVSGDREPKKVKTLSDNIKELESDITRLSEAYVLGGSADNGILANIKQKTTELGDLNAKLKETESLVSKAFGREVIKIPKLVPETKDQSGLLAGDRTDDTNSVSSLSNNIEISDDYISKAIEGTNTLTKANEGLKESYSALGAAIGDSLAQGGNSLGEFARTALKSAQAFIAAKLREYVAQQLLNSSIASGPFGLFLAPVIAGAAAGLFNTAINSLSVPALAEGGVVSGPRIVQVGEYAGAATNPEIIAPERKLTNIFSSVLARHGGGGGSTEVFGRLEGSDMLLSNRREERLRKRKSTA